MKTLPLIIAALGLLTACGKPSDKQIANPADYNIYLTTTEQPGLESAMESYEFWNSRIDGDTTGVGDISGAAGSYGALFTATGDIENLKKAEVLYKKGIELSANNKDGFTRSLAHNYISQHRFKEAKNLLEESLNGPSDKYETHLMLFDVYMELGQYEEAGKMLQRVENENRFSFLIRRSKWNDHLGNLPEAIRYMEKAKAIAETSNNKTLKIWSYTNLADFYGHAGRIEDSYKHYLKTLEIEPDNAYAKKGIAWIAYANDKNTEEANRILDAAAKGHKVPDYYLLKAEMAAYNGNTKLEEENLDAFLKAVANPLYGGMYNTYLIELYADKNPDKALTLAEKEIENRATPETYQLLAYAQLKAGQKEKALETINLHVKGKTYEPMAQYHSALIYKANGMMADANSMKKELQEAAFELGPVVMEEVNRL
ncbi:hypothetical protein G3O08_04160 [Cryomorpha ignava]|uniref:Tetratricopeptide repeat protein n=1 Tax=Cryomorpha ignava TaxID=101383 RepID=A0A7K3WME4_9FLAO|nr:tetratricopeptide repeat protein [Cryomorpha ignava]NEN22698.1 hypothetical protein [Cryomorpha ignava]